MKNTSLLQMGKLRLLVIFFSFAMFASGCAIGVTRVKLGHDPLTMAENKREGTILLEEFKDMRSKDKEIIGNKRNMYGMALGRIGVEPGVSLTKVLTEYFAEALRDAGYTVVFKESLKAFAPEKFDALVEGEVLTFWMDLYMAVWHNVAIKVWVKNSEGKILWEGTVDGKETNVLWVGVAAEYEKVIRQALTKALNRGVQEFSSEQFYQAVKSEKPRSVAREMHTVKEKLIPTNRGTQDVDWPHPRKEQITAPPIEQTQPVGLSVYSQLRLPKYEISRQVTDPSPEMMSLPGRWQGIWDMNGTPSALIIEKIKGRKVDLVYAWGFWGPMKERQPGHIKITGELTGPDPMIKFQYADAQYTFTLEEGKLKGLQEQPDMPANSIIMVKVE